MDKLLVFWIVTLCAGMAFWFYNNMDMQIDYERYPQLLDPLSGAKRKPIEILNISKVVKPSSQYINSTNAQERLYDLVQQFNLENPFIQTHKYSDKLDLRLSAWPVANQTKCRNHLKWIISQLNSHKNYTLLRGQLGYELTTFMDSFGRPEAGVYSGLTSWLGSYKSCQRVTLDANRIKTRYCIGRMRAKLWPTNDENSNPPTAIRVGMCLPETCDTSSFTQQRQIMEELIKLELPQIYKDELELTSIFCLPDERSPIRAIPYRGKIFILIVIGWLALVISCSIVYEVSLARKKQRASVDPSGQKRMSIIDEYNRGKSVHFPSVPEYTGPQNESGDKLSDALVEALSIRCSIKAFKMNTFHVKYKQGHRVKVDLSPINAFRVVMTFLVVLGHSGYLVSIFSRSLTNKIDIMTNDLALLGVSIPRVVDIFFIIFGLLTSYTLLRKFNINQLSNPLMWIAVNFGIFFRLGPLYMMVYWYSKLISPFTGSGPWWDYGVDSLSAKGSCIREGWWRSIPHLGSVKWFGSAETPDVPTCLLPGWFLISYSHISLIVPVITYILCKVRASYRCILVTYLSILSTMSIAYRLYNQEVVPADAFVTYGGLLPNLLEKFEPTGHMATLGRIGCVSVGSLTGYLLHSYETGKISRWPKWVCSRITLVSSLILPVIITFMPLIGKKIVSATDASPHLATVAGVDAVTSMSIPVVVSIIIINATTIYNHKVLMRFFGHTFWHVFNRLCLCIYLVHWEVLYVAITGFEQAPSYGFMADVMRLWAFGIFVSVVLAFVIHIIIEAPLARLLLVALRTFNRKSDMTQVEHKDSLSSVKPMAAC